MPPIVDVVDNVGEIEDDEDTNGNIIDGDVNVANDGNNESTVVGIAWLWFKLLLPLSRGCTICIWSLSSCYRCGKTKYIYFIRINVK